MGITVTRSGPTLQEQFFASLIERVLADCATRSPAGANVVVNIPLSGGHELRIDGAPVPISWSVRTDAGDIVDEGRGKPAGTVLSKWGLRDG